MATWLKDELQKIAEADDLNISPFREDGVTYGASKGADLQSYFLVWERATR